jgi:hypothetical protein
MTAKQSTTDTEPEWLLKQYYEGLSVSFLVAKELGDVPQGVSDRIDELFRESENVRRWGNAYEIEQCLTYLYDDEMLEEQLERRLIDLELHSDKERFLKFRERRDTAVAKRAKQELLRDITNNVQWYYRKRDVRREYHREARIKTLYVFLGALFVFAVALLVSHSEWLLSYSLYDQTTRALVIVICAGFLGASFSILLRVKTKLADSSIEDLRVLDNIHYIALRPVIGVGAALILFFLVQSGLLGGSLFPDLPLRHADRFIEHYGDISKMIVWSFIAGFSEYFVPNLLKQTESRATEETQAPSTNTKIVEP